MRKFNFESKHSWWTVEPGVDLVLYRDNMMHQSDNGKRDCIGRTWDAYRTYGDPRFLEAILRCWTYNGEDGKFHGTRYPTPYPGQVPISRDHVYNTIFALHHAVKRGDSSEEFFQHFVSCQPFRLSGFARQSLSMHLWLKLLQGKKIGYLYYPLTYLSVKGYKAWNRLIYGIMGNYWKLGDEHHQDDFKPILEFPRLGILDKLTGLLFPNYALMNLGQQLELLPNKKWVDRIRKQCHPLVPSNNYVGKLLFHHPDGVSRQEVEQYHPMNGDRWSDILNPWINYGRNIHKLDSSYLGENELDKDLLRTLWEERNTKE